MSPKSAADGGGGVSSDGLSPTTTTAQLLASSLSSSSRYKYSSINHTNNNHDDNVLDEEESDSNNEATFGSHTPLINKHQYKSSSKLHESFRLLTTKIHSLDLLIPGPESSLRRASFISAIFNLIATIVGGGVLSMPLAFAKTGIVLGTILMICAGIITDLSLYLLVCCARKTGATS